MTLPTPNDLDWILFAVVYLGIAVGTIPPTRLNRPAIALLGAIGVVAAGRMSFDRAIAHIDFATLALLFALMIVAANLNVAGFYARVIAFIMAHAHKPWTLLTGVILASAVLSAIFANDIICLAFAPVLCAGLKRAGKNPLPYLIALATSSNIGSAATLIGNPQNMLIGQSAHLSFGHYLAVVAPLVIVCLGINVLVVALVYRRTLFGAGPSALAVEPAGGMENVLVRPWHITKTLLITLGLVIVFLFTGVPREIAALVAAGLVLISRTQDPRKLLALVDWNLILLFIGLFVVIGNVQEKGLVDQAMAHLGLSPGNSAIYRPLPFSALTLVLSNLVSNVPAVLLLKPGLPLPAQVGDAATHTWYLLAVVSTFAGNLTLLGSIANLIVVEQSKPNGVEIGFAEYLKTGLPLTTCTTVLAVVYFGLLAR